MMGSVVISEIFVLTSGIFSIPQIRLMMNKNCVFAWKLINRSLELFVFFCFRLLIVEQQQSVHTPLSSYSSESCKDRGSKQTDSPTDDNNAKPAKGKQVVVFPKK